ncbi:MAG: DUF2892 domain-containing protein [Chitinophagaceae bacterium]|nr:DUF2892 domain-containing protein [Chitinophagaceae bacterium]
MKSNVSSADRILRIFVAIAVAALFFANVISGTTAIILLIIGGVLLLTSIINFCPLYYFLGLSTRKTAK